MAHASISGDGSQQRQAPGSNHARKVRPRIDFEEEVVIRRFSFHIILKPHATDGHVIEDQVEHQSEMATEFTDVVPGSQLRIHGPIVDDREAIVRRAGEKRQ